MSQRERLKQNGARALGLLQRIGVDIRPRHFYSSIPDLAHLQQESRWRAPRTMIGVAGADVSGQLEFARSLIPADLSATLGDRNIHATACAQNGATGFGPVEADFLFAFIHSRRPRRIVQIGAGVSTAVILAAARNSGYEPEIIAIDPYPTEFLRRAPLTLIEREAQDVAIEQVATLRHDDFLFVDSTHTVKTDSEVNLLILEVLPRLAPGVWVHFHDIYFPYDYQRDILAPPLFFWSESTLVHAFLVGNRDWHIAASLAMLHYARPRELADLIPRYRPEPGSDGLGTQAPSEGHFPSSLYLLRKPDTSSTVPAPG